MANNKEVHVKVVEDVEDSQVDALEKKIAALKKEKIDLKIQSNLKEIAEIDTEISRIKSEIKSLSSTELDVRTNTNEINKLIGDIEKLESKKIGLAIEVEKQELENAKAEVEDLDNKEVSLDLSIQNFSQGIQTAKQGVMELKQAVEDVQEAGMQSEQNLSFLTMNLGADKAKSTLQDINDIVASMPGDDNTMRSILSTAQATGAALSRDDMTKGVAAMADYMAGSAANGKMMAEVENDLKDYILNGNTACLERDSIYKSQIDKLKDLPTVQERINALQEAGVATGYAGLAQQDTLINKQAEWEGMIYNSQDALSQMWMGAEKGAVDYILQLNDATGGLAGMAIVAGQMAAGPLIDITSGLAQMAMGMKALKDLQIIQWFRDLEIITKLSAAADYLLAGAQAVLNAVMSMNPIVLVVLALIALAAALIWAYQNVDWFREMVDNAWASVVQFTSWLTGMLTDGLNNLALTFMNVGQIMYNSIVNAVNWIMGALQNLWNYIVTLGGLLPANVSITGNQIVDTIIRVLAFIATLPLQLEIIFINAIAKALGFGDNFVQSMIDAGMNAVNGFVSWITQLPGKLAEELNAMLAMAQQFIMDIANLLTGGAAGMVVGWITGSGEHSPGYMYEAFKGELSEMEKLPKQYGGGITSGMKNIGANMSNSFNPELGGTLNGSIGGGQVNNIYFNDIVVDNDERMERIAEYIAKKINWNNTTANRTI